MPLHSAILCDLQYLYAILALYMLGELTTFNCIISDQCHTIPSLEYERKRVLFIPPSVSNFSLERKSFCIL